MSVDVKGRVLKNIERDREDIVSFLKKLISIPSVTGNEKDIQEFIAGRLDDMGLILDIPTTPQL